MATLVKTYHYVVVEVGAKTLRLCPKLPDGAPLEPCIETPLRQAEHQPSSSPVSVGGSVGPPRARWRGDFETANLSQWSYLLNPRGLSIVETPAVEGRYAARVELQATDLWPNGLNRVEVQYKPPRETVTEGQQSCFAWSFFLPKTLSGARHQIGYWESYPSYKQIMSFEVRGQAITFVNDQQMREFGRIEKLIGYAVTKMPLPENLGPAPEYRPDDKRRGGNDDRRNGARRGGGPGGGRPGGGGGGARRR